MGTIQKESPVPIYKQVANFLRGEITQKNLKAGQHLPSRQEMCDRFSISHMTVTQALRELSSEGLVYQVPGKGTFVAETTQQTIESKLISLDKGKESEIASNIIGLLVIMHGHTYSELYRNLVGNIQDSGRLSLVVDIFNRNSSPSIKKKVTDLIERRPHSIILDAQIDFPFQILKDRESDIQNLIIINRLETKYQFRAHMVFSDYVQGGYLAIKHLIELGHKRILCIPHNYPFNKLSLDALKMQGMQKARREKGIDGTSHSVVLTQPPDIDEKKILEIFSSRKRPTAVFASSDSVVFQVYNLLRKIGLEVPKDVALVGYYNTPWSTETDIQITSLDINISQIAKKAVQLVDTSRGEKSLQLKRIFVEPTLIVRESSGTNIENSK